jgi:hypothetical protein
MTNDFDIYYKNEKYDYNEYKYKKELYYFDNQIDLRGKIGKNSEGKDRLIDDNDVKI